MDPRFAEWLRGVAEKGGEFVEREAPLYAQELIAWMFWSHVIAASLLGVVTLAFAAASISLWCSEDGKCLKREGNTALAALLGMFAIVTFGACANTASYAVKTVVAPRVVIVEHLGGK